MPPNIHKKLLVCKRRGETVIMFKASVAALIIIVSLITCGFPPGAAVT